MSGLLIAGTSSDAGKSLVVTGLARALVRRGVDVVPYKAQNMSNNSMVCRDGSEIGRAQYLQAQAAKVEPSSAMNPVLLKPGTDRRSFVVTRGRPDGVLEAGQYATGRAHLKEAAHAAYQELAASHELVLCEGAGSPAEINLRAGDYVNMGLARAFNLPVVLVGDIDRGGVLASLYGTWALLEDADRGLLSGYIINKFRGDSSVLAPGLIDITSRSGLRNFGVLPWLHGVWLDGEDALEVGRWRNESLDIGDSDLRIAVVRLPRISNATDVDALANEPGVHVMVTTDPRIIAGADIVVIPGSRSTVDDLAWLHREGIAEVIVARHQAGRPIVGICGGYQMLADTIDDDIESKNGLVAGLGALPVSVLFGEEKILARPQGQWREHQVDGYEIHHGICQVNGAAEPFLDGCRVKNTFGTLWHGAFECDSFRRAWLSEMAQAVGRSWTPAPDTPGYSDRREMMIETLADAVDEHLDVTALLNLAKEQS
ncbi:MAG: cobyric acid synthase [Propionibacteriaceae bacterium]